jgi:tetrahydromethanopterin S-methyltransferase subunit E
MLVYSLKAFAVSNLSGRICAGVSTLGLSIGLNAVSGHATCSIVFGFVAYFVISTVASIRKIHKLGWIT